MDEEKNTEKMQIEHARPLELHQKTKFMNHEYKRRRDKS
jgi:hypothetical protein